MAIDTVRQLWSRIRRQPFRTFEISAQSAQYEYGSRVGWWRLYRMFTERRLPVTIFGIASSLQKNPEAVAAMKEAGFEIASHGLRSIQHADMPEEEEAKQIEEAIRIHGEVTGARPTGWYTGRWSVNTRRLLTRAGGFYNDSDSFADELPYWTEVEGRDHLIVPYTLVNNDIRYVNTYGYQSPTFSSYLIFRLLNFCGAKALKARR